MNLLESLFYVPHIDWGAAKEPLYKRMFATILMSLDEMFTKFGNSNFMVSRLIQISNQFQFRYTQIIQWGQEIREYFNNKNFLYQQPGSSPTGVDPQNLFQKMCLDNQLRLGAVETRLKTVEAQQREILDLQRQNSGKLDSCITLFSSILRNCNTSRHSGERNKRASKGSLIILMDPI